jgi:hypothetical protein
MAIDQRDVSSTLRFMDDRALQQYAAMHKNDPYIFPLAFQESQNRQKLRMSQQAQMAQQPQPKVAEQALAQMAPQQPRPMAQPMPEAQGIGALPAGNMEGMADGGIAGYEGYDESGVPNTFGEGPVRMMAEGGVARYQVGGDTMGGFSGMSPEQAAALELKAENEQKLRQISELEKQVTFLTSVGAPQAQQARAQLDVLKSTMGPKPSPTDPSFRRQEDPRMRGTAATSPARPLITSDAAPKVDTGRKTPAAAVDPASAGLAGIKDPAKLYQDILAKQEYKDPAADALLELEARERANAAADRQAIVSDAERFKDAFKGRESRLAERGAEIGKQKESNTGLALLNAGLAIMSTPGGLATAIGKGAQVGTAQFAAGLDKIRSAQERLDEARDRLDDLKLNREETTAKELRAAERNYRDVATNAQKRTIDGIRTAAGVNRADAKNIYDKTIDVQKTIYEQGEQTKRTRMQVDAANRTPAEIQMIERIMKERNIPFSEALSFISGAKREGVSEEKLRGEWLDQAKRLQIAQDYPNVKTFEDYKMVMGMGGGGAGGFKVVGVR